MYPKPPKEKRQEEKRLYFDLREALRLRKILEKMETPSEAGNLEQLSFYIARRQLHEMTEVLSQVSPTLACIRRLLYLTEVRPFPEESKKEMETIFGELRAAYQFPALETK